MLRYSTVERINGSLTGIDRPGKETAVAWFPNGNELDQDIFDALTEFFTELVRRGETLAEEFGVPAFCVKAIPRLDTSVTMKELGRRMHCDPSFVTSSPTRWKSAAWPGGRPMPPPAGPKTWCPPARA